MLVVAVVLAFVALAALAYTLAGLLWKDDAGLAAALRPYDGMADETRVDVAGEVAGEQSHLPDAAFVRRAVALTEDMARRQGVLVKVEAALERADLPLRAGEALVLHLAAFAVGLVAAAVLLPPVLALAAAGGLALTPPAVVTYLAGRRRRKFVSQLPDTLRLLASSLRAGYSLLQGVEAVSQEVEDPMGAELRRVLAEARLGRPVEVSLEEGAQRMGSGDFAWAVMAINIQREVGGNLAELLVTVADTMTQRERLRRDVKALTAEGRVSAIVLGLLPVGLGAAIYVLNRDYVSLLFEERIGHIMLGGATVLAAVGFWWMKKTIEIEV